ncbi:MAG: hypothetical protein J7K73_01565 [Nanoarchaeota archaeon]|nr:hypothetical protein [Nanoarchaeota archaeon]
MLEDLGISWRKVADMLVEGKIEFEVISTPIGDYLAIDIPDELIGGEKDGGGFTGI